MTFHKDFTSKLYRVSSLWIICVLSFNRILLKIKGSARYSTLPILRRQPTLHDFGFNLAVNQLDLDPDPKPLIPPFEQVLTQERILRSWRWSSMLRVRTSSQIPGASRQAVRTGSIHNGMVRNPLQKDKLLLAPLTRIILVRILQNYRPLPSSMAQRHPATHTDVRLGPYERQHFLDKSLTK